MSDRLLRRTAPRPATTHTILKVENVAPHGLAVDRAPVSQRKTGHPVRSAPPVLARAHLLSPRPADCRQDGPPQGAAVAPSLAHYLLRIDALHPFAQPR